MREKRCGRKKERKMKRMWLVYICMFIPVSCCVCAQVYILKKDEGGRHTPFVNNYSPQLYTRTASVNTSMILPEGQLLVSLTPPPPLSLSLSLSHYDRVVIGRERGIMHSIDSGMCV